MNLRTKRLKLGVSVLVVDYHEGMPSRSFSGGMTTGTIKMDRRKVAEQSIAVHIRGNVIAVVERRL